MEADMADMNEITFLSGCTPGPAPGCRIRPCMFAALVDRLTTLALRSPSDGLRS